MNVVRCRVTSIGFKWSELQLQRELTVNEEPTKKTIIRFQVGYRLPRSSIIGEPFQDIQTWCHPAQRRRRLKEQAGKEVAIFPQTLRISDEIPTHSRKFPTEEISRARNFEFAPQFPPNWFFSTRKFCIFGRKFPLQEDCPSAQESGSCHPLPPLGRCRGDVIIEVCGRTSIASVCRRQTHNNKLYKVGERGEGRGRVPMRIRTVRRPCRAPCRAGCWRTCRSRASRWKIRVWASSTVLRWLQGPVSRRSATAAADVGGRWDRSACRGTGTRRSSSRPSSVAARSPSPSRTDRSRRPAGSDNTVVHCSRRHSWVPSCASSETIAGSRSP